MTFRALVVAEHARAELSPATAKTLACVAALGDVETTVVVFADDAAAVAAQAAALAGVSRVLTVEHPAHRHPLAAMIAPQLAELAAGFSHVFAPATTFGKDLLPRAAALIGTAQVSDVMAVESGNRFKRPIYAGNAIATVEVDGEVGGEPVVATVRVSSFEAVQAVGAGVLHAPIERAEPKAELPAHTRFVSLDGGGGDRPDLQSATRVVTGGRGVASAEGFGRLNQLADLLGAAVGASRAAVDAGFAPNELQVGQTGKIIAPELYIALGVSGAIQHVAGIKDARTIVAINKDGDAPIFEVADIGLVADLFSVLPELEQLLAKTD